jgi:hypothetical protein
MLARSRLLVFTALALVVGCSSPRKDLDPAAQADALPGAGGAGQGGAGSGSAVDAGDSRPLGDVPLVMPPPPPPGTDSGLPGPAADAAAPPVVLPPCPAGQHRCGANCVLDTDVANCGPAACTPCLPPAGSQATCDGQRCAFACPTGSHACRDGCAEDNNVLSCGNRCEECPRPDNGQAACTNRRCTIKCNAFFFSCDGVCKDYEQASCTDRKVIVVPRAQAPARTAEAEPRCGASDVAGPRTDCPVLQWGPYRAWAFSYNDNRNTFLVRVYQGTTLVMQLDAEGGHDLYKIRFDDQLVYLSGIGGEAFVSWSDLPTASP